MTTAILLRVLASRWYVLLVGAIVTFAGIQFVSARPGVFLGEVRVVFLNPPTARFPNSIQQTSSGAIASAGLVQRMIEGTQDRPATSAVGVTLPSRGIYSGYTIRLPDSGGQWEHNFSRPVLDVEVVGSEPGAVRSELRALVNRIEDELADLQSADGIPARNRITTSADASPTDVRYVGGKPTLALLMTGALGVWLTLLAAVGFDRLAGRRRAGLGTQLLPGADATG